MIAELYLQSFKKKASADIALKKTINSKTLPNIELKKDSLIRIRFIQNNKLLVLKLN